MADKVSTLILKVDLHCPRCYKKIRRTLCKLQDRWNIQNIEYDEKNDTVTVSGTFDPHKLSKKLCCKACKVIKDIQIKEDPKPAPEPAPEPPPPPPPAPEPPPPAPSPPPPAPAPPPPEPEPEPPKPAPAPEPPKPAPEPAPKFADPVCPPVLPYVPVCCCWYHGACRCCSCGRGGYGWEPPVVYGGPCYDGYKTCELICEEDTSCRIM